MNLSIELQVQAAHDANSPEQIDFDCAKAELATIVRQFGKETVQAMLDAIDGEAPSELAWALNPQVWGDEDGEF